MKKMTWGLYTLFFFFRCSWVSNSILGQFQRFVSAFFNQQKALLLFEEMLKVQLQYDSISCRATIRACERGKQWQQVLALFASMSGWSRARYLWSMFPDDYFCSQRFHACEHGMIISPWPMLVDRMQLVFSMISCLPIQFRILICDIFHCWIPFRPGCKNSADGWESQVDEKDAELLFLNTSLEMWVSLPSCFEEWLV